MNGQPVWSSRIFFIIAKEDDSEAPKSFMKQQLLLSLAITQIVLSGYSRDFDFKYEGQTITYTVLDEDAKTCEIVKNENNRKISGKLVIPSKVCDQSKTYYDVINIGENAFQGCSDLTELVIPSSVTKIGSAAFYFCYNLESVVLPSYLESIEDELFSDCYKLKSVSMPLYVRSIGNSAFKSSALISIDLPSSLLEIGSGAFSSCSKLISVYVPPFVTNIGDYAFSDCKNLQTVILPNSLGTINRGLFSGSSNLTSIFIPNSINSIGTDAFRNCSLNTVVIPSSVLEIAPYAFAYCGLKNIIMGCNIERIYSYAFFGSNAIVNISAQTPPDLSDEYYVFNNFNSLYVQGEETLNLYKSSRTWSNFKTIDTMSIPESIEIDKMMIGGLPGDTIRLNARITPNDVTLPYLFYHSTNPEIATVDHEGLVTFTDKMDVETCSDDAIENPDECKIIVETLYSNGPIAEVSVMNKGDVTLIKNIESVTTPIYPKGIYNLQGVKVGNNMDRLSPGIYLCNGKKIRI